MVLRANDRKFGLIVDKVSEVLNIAGENIEPAPAFSTNVETDFILGMGKVGQSVKILLDIDRVLSSEDVIVPPSTETPIAKAA